MNAVLFCYLSITVIAAMPTNGAQKSKNGRVPLNSDVCVLSL
jgi:hypothetical protein